MDQLSREFARRVLDGLPGEPLAVAWDDETDALKRTGRLALTDAERSGSGPAADRLSLLGSPKADMIAG
ncbi:MAG TPA: hypothetical protein VMU94_08125 [Streptosporangiaceae bacterium]|nr:hypothetical protein [Streptosporangiaceae bacterium]